MLYLAFIFLNTYNENMKHKKLYNFKLNEIVYIIKDNKWDKIVYIDDHVQGNFCMSQGGRYYAHELDKDHLGKEQYGMDIT